MGSKERITRLKAQTRVNILDAAHDIVKDEGWQALSMRKIADKIEYTAPIIYEYYANKEAILLELTKKGLQPTNVQNKEGDAYSQQIVVPGALMYYNGREAAVNLLENTPGTGALASSTTVPRI